VKPPSDPLPWSESVRADSPERQRFLESHVDLVRYLAVRIAARLPASVELDDLTHDGIVGLLDAVDKYDPSRGVRFRTYAEARVRGAILDGLRQRDWRSRSVRRHQRELAETIERLSSIHGRAATEEEIARAMKLDLADYRQLLQEVTPGSLMSMDELAACSQPASEAESVQPHLVLERRQLLEALAEELTHLPGRERRVLELYYCDELTMKEVGAVLGVTESRVCQLHSQAAARLRGLLRARLHVAAEPLVEAGKR
jgi:RNA polymerase sigma factor for flagellar operon FliA